MNIHEEFIGYNWNTEEQTEEAEVIDILLKLFLILKLLIQITTLLFENICHFSAHLGPFFGGVLD